MKVISFSLWGDNPKYCIGAIKNAELAKQIYPDWVCRFYISRDVPLDIQGQLANCDNVDLIEIPDSMNGWKGMFARFLPANEPEVEVFISRDCDSRLTTREKAAVDEWLASPKGFHIIRDHPWHGTKILGGMFGMKKGCLLEFNSLMEKWKQEDKWQTDQTFLAAEIYPRVLHDAFIHDSFFNSQSEEIHALPIPRIELEFIGQVFDENDITITEHAVALRDSLHIERR